MHARTMKGSQRILGFGEDVLFSVPAGGQRYLVLSLRVSAGNYILGGRDYRVIIWELAPKSPELPETGLEDHCSARGDVVVEGAEDSKALFCFVS